MQFKLESCENKYIQKAVEIKDKLTIIFDTL